MKKCPFCGSIDIQTHCKKIYGEPVEIKGMRYWRVECLDCGSRTRDCFDNDAHLDGFEDGKEKAISLWDTRKEKESISDKVKKCPTCGCVNIHSPYCSAGYGEIK